MEHEQAHLINESSNLRSEDGKEEEKEEEEEETLSLCDLPLNHNSASKRNSFDDTSFKLSLRQPVPEATLFEFFDGFSISDMCPADDIIFCGRLVPLKDKDIDQSPRTHENFSNEQKNPSTYRRRSESLSSLQSSVTRSNSVSTSRRLMMRNSRSLDNRRLRRSSSSVVSPAPEIERNCSARSVVPSETAVKKAMKPRWFSLLFGTVKVPPEMELNDMKNRQFRRNPSTTMFSAMDSDGKLAVNRSSGKVSWKILKALSCKDHTSVAVTTSFALPQAT